MGELSGEHQRALEWAVLDALASGPIEVDHLLAGFPSHLWNQVLVAVDGLSRRRAVRLSRPSRGSYLLRLGEPPCHADAGQSLSKADLEGWIRET